MKVFINNEADCSLLFDNYDSWKDYCNVSDFDNTYVLTGNRHFHDHTEAEWYNKVLDLIKDFDNECTREDFSDLSDEQYTQVKEIYDNCKVSDDFTTIIKFLGVLYPNDTFKQTTIRGYTQGDWQDVLYKETADVDINLLESIYFGKVAEMYYEDEDGLITHTYVTDDELWKAENENKIEELVEKHFSFLDDGFEVYKADGYTRIINWKRIN